MKIICKIARAEFRTLFYSPVAWIVLVVFFVITGIQFLNPLMDFARVQELQIANNPGWLGFDGPLTFNLFNSSIGKMLEYLYLFIPLLTMGTINREVNAGTMKLLSSSPVSIREIVLGKFVGLTALNLALLSAIALLLFTGYFSIQHAEFKWYCSMLLGFFCLSSTYMAIGLFISCITNYQIVAGIATFIAFFLINLVGGILQEYDFIRDITWFLSLAGRTENLILGLITTRDIFYFILVVVLFLGLAMINLKSKQESKKWTVSFSRYFMLIAVILITGYFSSRPGYVGYYDVTTNKLNTIDTAMQSVLKELDGSPLTVTLYTNLLNRGARDGLPVARNEYIWGFWDRFLRFYPNIQLKYEYYYDIKPGDSTLYKSSPKKNIHQIAAQFARLFKVDTAGFRKPGEINKITDMGREDMWRLLMELEYKGRKSFLRTFDSPLWPEQSNVAASIREISKNNIPRVLFTTGHYERSPWRNGEREFGGHTNVQANRLSMINRGLNADTLSLLHREIPVGTDLLVIADPKSELTPLELARVQQHIEKGGNLLFYAEPGKQYVLNSMLHTIGVQLENGRLVMPRLHQASDFFIGAINETGRYMAREKALQIAQRVGKDLAKGGFAGACHISFKDTLGFKAEPIIPLPGKQIWVENGLYVPDSAKPVFDPGAGDWQRSEYILGVRLTRKINNKEQRIVVLSDADFMSPNYGNGSDIALGIYSWLVYNKYPVYETVIEHADIRVAIGKTNAKILWYVYIYGIPALILVVGSVILIRRKRK
ncbi:ABC transporter permease subunit [Pseudobacter ginsenosidimutans]|uniref:ABC-2 type transport system permease protein n=1 Tax=Pseudobacter ginsenosidimutans TaxID=661488 RepID=A0A4Q7N580_9BACT|nr:Gldg family protein [Pseudobacter ginsenosidimutans]QEC44723.1 ABC transporter permease subunit [Pseudobacter ginsenosidimutans]RZS76204.1 ABC-2 type transport system permease protein [Pseudobacter ginsenosidimutans]